jgi:nicotinamidase-related amidase
MSLPPGTHPSLPCTLDDLCRPDRMALVVYDMQIGIVRQLPNGADLVARVATVLEAARGANMRIVFLRHLSMPVPWMGTFQTRMAMAWQRTQDPSQVKPWFLRDGPAFPIVDELKPRDDEAVLDKITMSAFEGTPLAILLRDAGLTSFALVGAAIEIGIDPTVRHAADLGLIPVLIEDALGSGHEEAAARSLENMRFIGDAMFTDAARFAAMLSRSSASVARSAS